MLAAVVIGVVLDRTRASSIFDRATVAAAVAFEELPLLADPGLTMTAYTAEPGPASNDALHLLASWATLDNQVQSADHSAQQGARLDEPS